MYQRVYYACIFSYIQIVSQSNFLPAPFTQAQGMEIEKLSYLGPFLALSVFAEEGVKVVEKYFKEPSEITVDQQRLINKQLQQHMEIARGELYKIVHNLLVNAATREAAMDFVAACVDRNNKRSQLQVREGFVI